MKKINDIKSIRLIKIVQIILFLLGNVLLSKGFSSYFSYAILIVILLLAIPIPKQYKWGFTAEKTTFLRNNNAVIETAISLIIIISLAILIGIFI
ncbi:hypothetical protein P7H30_06570 [Streptococcus parauberis]|uniref:hypothetical protein n=1 Tax=Streptococcus parauberis TaxID=1348 RepID=UPI0028903F69|nr:hypothetical protein [Streptococcus parauberis]MDT2749405.1 hypothetical protein [Streptococcus parauberis]